MDTWDTIYKKIEGILKQERQGEAEDLTKEAFKLYPDNPEALYLLTRTFRERSQHQKAWEYYSLWRSSTFSDTIQEHYTPLFLYEKTILNYYVGSPKQEGLTDFIVSYNKGICASYTNLEYYVYPYTCHEIHHLPFKPIGDYHATSTSILPYGDTYLLNIRYVNYIIQPDSSYLMMENGILHPHHHIRTRNYNIIISKDFIPISDIHEMIPNEPPRHNTYIHGIEDIRLFYKDTSLHFIGASCEYSQNGNIQQVIGKYNIESHLLTNISQIHSPKGNDVEKNWIPIDECYIYSWHPFTLGYIEASEFKIKVTYDTPLFFQHMRGSTPTFLYEGFYYCIVHCIIDSRPRKYYHSLVKLDTNYIIQSYTLPLYFQNNHIEYTIGMVIKDDTLACIVSQNDTNPILVKIAMSTLTWIPIQT